MITIHADELQPGDVIDDHGACHRVTTVNRGNGWAWPVASDGTGWAIALGHELVEVERDRLIARCAVSPSPCTEPVVLRLPG